MCEVPDVAVILLPRFPVMFVAYSLSDFVMVPVARVVTSITLTLANDQLDAQILNTFITILYMPMSRAISCSSSGGQIVLIQHLSGIVTLSK
jgi:hypothetical protein